MREFAPSERDLICALEREHIKSDNARMIYRSISGFGRQEPFSNKQSYDAILQAFSGTRHQDHAPPTTFDGKRNRHGSAPPVLREHWDVDTSTRG